MKWQHDQKNTWILTQKKRNKSRKENYFQCMSFFRTWFNCFFSKVIKMVVLIGLPLLSHVRTSFLFISSSVVRFQDRARIYHINNNSFTRYCGTSGKRGKSLRAEVLNLAGAMEWSLACHDSWRDFYETILLNQLRTWDIRDEWCEFE